MYKYLLPLILLCNISLAQSPLEYTVTQATFLKADAAKIYELEDSVSIQVEGLKPESTKAAVLTIDNDTFNYIEVSELVDFNGITVAVFPPKTLYPAEENTYHIEGLSGQRFGVAIRTSDTVKWIEVLIEGTPTPAPPLPVPPEDYAQITDLVKTSTQALQDPTTTSAIKKELEQLSLSEVLSEAKEEVKEAVAKGLRESMKILDPPYKDWETGFKVPLNTLIASLEITTSQQLQKVVDAIVAGMESTSTVTIYSKDDCNICTSWKQEVWPTLEKAGWTLKVVEDDYPVPKFQVCTNGLCSQKVQGYMTVEQFSQIVSKMRDSN